MSTSAGGGEGTTADSRESSSALASPMPGYASTLSGGGGGGGNGLKEEKDKDKDGQKKVSCLGCREAKVKCTIDAGEERCKRCSKYEIECRFEGHKRGRRKGKIKHQQITRRFELIARALEELRALTSSLQDPAAMALVASLRYQLISSTCVSEEARMILNSSQSLAASDKGKKRERSMANDDGLTSSDEGEEASPHPAQIDPRLGAIQPTTAAMSMMDTRVDNRSITVTPRPPPGSFSRDTGLEQHRGSPGRRGLSSQGGRDAMLRRARGADSSQVNASKSASLLAEIEDFESVAIVPQAVQTLSNPLKLLAHASDAVDAASRSSAGAGGSGRASAPAEQQHRFVYPHARAPIEDDELVPAHRRLNQTMDQREAAAWAHFVSTQRKRSRGGKDGNAESGDIPRDSPVDDIEWSSYFSRGAFHPRYDAGGGRDPIERGLVSLEQAETLLTFFYANFGTFIHCFDPNLSTLSYLRKHSAFAVCVIAYVAADFHPEPQYAGIARRLEEEVDEMLPSIMSGVYKSVEAAQACLLLASYQRMADSAVDDQTWALLGTAIRIASELGCNLACFSYSAPAGDPAIEKHHRQLKNTERLWLSLWIHERTLEFQTGQKLFLAEDPIIAACGTWHQRPYAVTYQDEALVAFVDLRRIMDRHASTFHTQILRALTSPDGGGPHSKRRETGHSEQLMLLVDLFRANVHVDFKRWEESWLASSTEGAVAGRSPLMSTGILHLHFATLVILSLPLRSASERPTHDFDALRRDCYGAAIGFLSAFVDRAERGLLPCITNALAVSAVYCSIFALKLAVLSVEIAPFINRERVAKLAKGLARELQKAGSYPSHRSKRSVPARFAEYLFGYLSRWEALRSPRLISAGTTPLAGSRRPSSGGSGALNNNNNMTMTPFSTFPESAFVPHHQQNNGQDGILEEDLDSTQFDLPTGMPYRSATQQMLQQQQQQQQFHHQQYNSGQAHTTSGGMHHHHQQQHQHHHHPQQMMHSSPPWTVMSPPSTSGLPTGSGGGGGGGGGNDHASLDGENESNPIVRGSNVNPTSNHHLNPSTSSSSSTTTTNTGGGGGGGAPSSSSLPPTFPPTSSSTSLSTSTTSPSSLDDFWKSMSAAAAGPAGGSWDSMMTGFAPLLDQMAGFEFITSVPPPNAPGGGPGD